MGSPRGPGLRPGMVVSRAPEVRPSLLFRGSQETDGALVTRAGAWPPGGAAFSRAQVLELPPGQPSREGGHGAKGRRQGNFQAL